MTFYCAFFRPQEKEGSVLMVLLTNGDLKSRSEINR